MISPEVFELTDTQAFQLDVLEKVAPHLPPNKAKELLLEITRLLMLKDNEIKQLTRNHLGL